MVAIGNYDVITSICNVNSRCGPERKHAPRVTVKALIVAGLRSRKTKKIPVKTGLTLRKYFWG